MSLYNILNIDIPNAYNLRKRILMLGLYNNKIDIICSICLKYKFQELYILITKDSLFRNKDNINLICSKCKIRLQNNKQIIVVTYKTLISILNTIIDQEIATQALSILKQIEHNLTQEGTNNNRKICGISLMKYINQKLGINIIESQQQYIKGLNDSIIDFYNQLQNSYISKYYCSLISYQFRLQPAFVNILRHFSKRQRKYKIQLLYKILYLSKNIIDIQDLTKWIKKIINGMNNYILAFTSINIDSSKILYSLTKNSIQLRTIYNSKQQQQEEEKQILITQFPIHHYPTIFKITSYGYGDQFQIGLFYAGKKCDKSNGYQMALPPLLFHFQIMIKYDQSDIKRNILIDKRSNHIDRTNHIDGGNIDVGNNKDGNVCNIKQDKKLKDKMDIKSKKDIIYEIEDEDEIQLIVDYRQQIIKIKNNTQQNIILQKSYKSQSSRKYILFPCIKLIGSKIMIQKIK